MVLRLAMLVVLVGSTALSGEDSPTADPKGKSTGVQRQGAADQPAKPPAGRPEPRPASPPMPPSRNPRSSQFSPRPSRKLLNCAETKQAVPPKDAGKKQEQPSRINPARKRNRPRQFGWIRGGPVRSPGAPSVPPRWGGGSSIWRSWRPIPLTFYVATASGGLFKTTNNGTTFTAIFQQEKTVSIGDVCVSDSEPNILWVGTGEHNARIPRPGRRSISPRIAAERGRIWDCRSRSRLAASRSTPRTRTLCTSAAGGSGEKTNNGASTRLPTAERPGQRSYTLTRKPAVLTSPCIARSQYAHRRHVRTATGRVRRRRPRQTLGTRQRFVQDERRRSLLEEGRRKACRIGRWKDRRRLLPPQPEHGLCDCGERQDRRWTGDGVHGNLGCGSEPSDGAAA